MATPSGSQWPGRGRGREGGGLTRLVGGSGGPGESFSSSSPEPLLNVAAGAVCLVAEVAVG